MANKKNRCSSEMSKRLMRLCANVFIAYCPLEVFWETMPKDQ